MHLKESMGLIRGERTTEQLSETINLFAGGTLLGFGSTSRALAPGSRWLSLMLASSTHWSATQGLNNSPALTAQGSQRSRDWAVKPLGDNR